MAVTKVSSSLIDANLTISGGTVDNTVIGSGVPAAGTFTTIGGTLASSVTGTTQSAGDNSTKIATTAYVDTATAALVDSAPSTLDTLNELAAALGDDANFSTTVTNSIALKAPLANPTFTGSFTSPGIDDNANATAITIDSSENVGIGVIPETHHSGVSALQVGLAASLVGHKTNPSRTYLNANSYINSSNVESYVSTDEASQYFQNAGTHTFKVAPSGTADSAISWNTAMTIDNSGNVGIGTSSPDQLLQLGSETYGANAIIKTQVDGSDAGDFDAGLHMRSHNDDFGGSIVLESRSGINDIINFKYHNNSSAGVSAMAIDATNGNVGIGTSTVLDGLNIYASSNTNLRLHNGTTGASTSAGGIIQQAGNEMYVWNYEPSNLIFGTNNAEAMRISGGDLILAANATGAALIKGVSGDQTDRNSGGYPQFTFVGNEGTGIRRPSANVLAFDTSGDEAMRIDSGGNVGIGGNGTGNSLGVYLNKGAVANFYEATDGTKTMITGTDAGNDYVKIGSLSAHPVGFVVGNSEKVRIDSNGNVGIGGSPAASNQRLYVKTVNDTDNSQGLVIERSANTDRGYINYKGGAFRLIATDGDPIRLGHVSNADRVTVDASGNLLVGGTSTTPHTNTTTPSTAFMADGQIRSAANSEAVVELNRTVSDGDIAVFRKSGSTVGSIGTVSGTDIELNSTLSGSLSAGGTKRFGWNTSGVFFPHTDNANDLGASGSRFKDLYLSGGVVFGGASGSVTYATLDTYEEGNFSPTITGEISAFSTSGQDTTGKYVRIGNWVHLEMDGYITTPTGGSGTLRITGLPFSMPAGRSAVGSMSAGRWDNSVSGDGWAPFIAAGTNYLQFRAAEAYSGSGDGIETASTATISGNTTPYWAITISFRVS